MSHGARKTPPAIQMARAAQYVALVAASLALAAVVFYEHHGTYTVLEQSSEMSAISQRISDDEHRLASDVALQQKMLRAQQLTTYPDGCVCECPESGCDEEKHEGPVCNCPDEGKGKSLPDPFEPWPLARGRRAMPMHMRQARAPGFSQGEARAPGYSQGEARAPGFNQGEARAPGYSQGEARAPGYSQGEARAPGFNQGEARAPGYSQGEARAPRFYQGEARAPGFNQGEARAPGYSQGEARAPRFYQGEARAPGFNQGEARAPGYSQGEARAPRFYQGEARAPGYSQGEVRAPGYDRDDMRNSGLVLPPFAGNGNHQARLQKKWVGSPQKFLPPDGDYPGGQTGIPLDGYLAYETGWANDGPFHGELAPMQEAGIAKAPHPQSLYSSSRHARKPKLGQNVMGGGFDDKVPASAIDDSLFAGLRARGPTMHALKDLM